MRYAGHNTPHFISKANHLIFDWVVWMNVISNTCFISHIVCRFAFKFDHRIHTENCINVCDDACVYLCNISSFTVYFFLIIDFERNASVPINSMSSISLFPFFRLAEFGSFFFHFIATERAWLAFSELLWRVRATCVRFFSLSIYCFFLLKIILHAIIAIRSWKIARQQAVCYKPHTYSRFSRLNNSSRAGTLNKRMKNQRRGTAR